MLDADRTDLGRLFQAIGPAVANACWPKLVRVLGTIRSPIVAERRRRTGVVFVDLVHQYSSHYWGFQNHSCSNSWLPTWFLQFSPGWHIRFYSGSPSACPEHSCSGSHTKASVLPHHTCSSWFALASGSPQNQLLKSLQLLTGCYNFSRYPILLLSSRDMYRREHSDLLHLCQYVFPHVKPPWQPPNHSHLLLRVSGMHCRIICRPSQLFLFLEELALKHHLFLVAYPDSNTKSGIVKPAQCISLRDTVPTTAIAQPANTMPPIHLSAYDSFRIDYILAHGEILCYYLLT